MITLFFIVDDRWVAINTINFYYNEIMLLEGIPSYLLEKLHLFFEITFDNSSTLTFNGFLIRLNKIVNIP